MNILFKNELEKILLNHKLDISLLNKKWNDEDCGFFRFENYFFDVQEIEINYEGIERITISELRVFQENKIIFYTCGLMCYEFLIDDYFKKQGLFFNNQDNVVLYYWMDKVLL